MILLSMSSGNNIEIISYVFIYCEYESPWWDSNPGKQLIVSNPCSRQTAKGKEQLLAAAVDDITLALPLSS